MIRADVAAGKHGGKVVTRFPPEPNGYLHIGHAKAICIDFGVAKEFGGRCHLRMDDTNPTTEDMEYVEAIQRDVHWLGFDWGEHLYYASDYFERFYELGEKLIRLGRAYVCDLPEEEFSEEYRGTITEAGKESPYRDAHRRREPRPLPAHARGRVQGRRASVLRAKIDMASPNMKMRDPPLVRIKHAHHYRTGDAWCIYPLYDYAHCLEDSFEGVTHSLCTMEFESARELYDWVIAATEVPHVPQQTEFARLNLTYTVMSKRKLLAARRGEARERLGRSAHADARRASAARLHAGGDSRVLREDRRREEHLDGRRRAARVVRARRPRSAEPARDGGAPAARARRSRAFPRARSRSSTRRTGPRARDRRDGDARDSRKLPFSRTLFIERDDFAGASAGGLPPPRAGPLGAPPARVHRHVHGRREGRSAARSSSVRCTHDPATRGGSRPRASSVDGTIHWVSAEHAVDVEVRLYDRLFSVENPGDGERDFSDELNPRSLEVVRAKAEPSLGRARAGDRFQFERVGFFFVDPRLEGRRVRVQPHRSAQGLLGEGRRRKRTPARRSRRSKKNARKRNARARKPGEGGEGRALARSERARRDAHGLSDEGARVIAQEPLLASLFEQALGAPGGRELAKPVAPLLVNDVLGEARAKKLETLPLRGAALVELVGLLARRHDFVGAGQRGARRDARDRRGSARDRRRRRDSRRSRAATRSSRSSTQVLAENADAVGALQGWQRQRVRRARRHGDEEERRPREREARLRAPEKSPRVNPG